jgi:hypothetical protein
MKFIKDGECYKVVRITGPAHNILGLVFADTDFDESKIEMLALDNKKDELAKINAYDVKYYVVLGIGEINKQLNTDYKLKRIIFLPSDTPSLEAYRELAKQIIIRLHEKNRFSN